MSRESMDWLNKMVLVGFTDHRSGGWRDANGYAWHYRTENQGDESNHYPDAIPVDDVLRRLFNFEVAERPLYILTDTGYREVVARKAMVTSDTEDILGIFKAGYQGHGYKEWLLDSVGTILDDDLGIGCAMLLRNRAQAAVSVEVPESITTPEGVEFRPNLLAATSFDGSLATTFKRVVTDVLCDNSKDAAMGESGQQFKVKHTKYSAMKIRDARDALAIVHTMGEDFADEVSKLCAWKVSDVQFKSLLDHIVPLPEDQGRGMTLAENKRGDIVQLYNYDGRCAPWKGTAYGVVQSFNTWNHHYATVRSGANGDATRFQRNMENVINGKTAAKDNEVLAALATITS